MEKINERFANSEAAKHLIEKYLNILTMTLLNKRNKKISAIKLFQPNLQSLARLEDDAEVYTIRLINSKVRGRL